MTRLPGVKWWLPLLRGALAFISHFRQCNFLFEAILLAQRRFSTRFESNIFVGKLYSAFVVYIPVLISGMQAGFPAFIIPQLRREMNLDVDQLSWLASLGYFSLILGPLTTMFFINKYGRKTNLRLILVLFALGWTVILVSNNFANLIIGSTLCGIASGSSGIIASVYVAEVSRARYRGSTLSMVFLVSIIGTSSVYSLEYYLPWRRAVAIIVLISLCGILLLRTVPESKHWYLMRDRKDDAKRSAAWFEDTPVVAKEVDILHLLKKAGDACGDQIGAAGNDVGFTLSDVKNLQMKPFLLATIVSTLRCGTGKVLFVVYPVNLFADMHTPFDSFALSICYGFLNLVCCFANMVVFSVVDKFNRKHLFYWLSGAMIAALAVVVCIESLSDELFKPLPGVRVFCVYAYLIVETTGYFCITSVIIVEVIPIAQRGLALSLNFVIANVVCAVYVKIFPSLERDLSFGGLCTFFLLNVALVAWVVHRYIPETGGRMLFGGSSGGGVVDEALIDGKFDALMKEDWLRNEQVQQFFTATANFGIDRLDTDLLKSGRREWLEKMKEMMNGGLVECVPTMAMATATTTMTSADRAQSSRTAYHVVPDNPFDFDKMTENSQAWYNSVKSNWNAWSQNEFVTAGNEMLKQQQKWFKDVWMKNMEQMSVPVLSMPGRQSRRAQVARQKTAASKTKATRNDEKII